MTGVGGSRRPSGWGLGDDDRNPSPFPHRWDRGIESAFRLPALFRLESRLQAVLSSSFVHRCSAMITRIEALNYRCFRLVGQNLGPFHILVGPNASGKSTFLDVPALLRDLSSVPGQDIGDVISTRSRDYRDLLWMRQGSHFELAIEARIPEDLRQHLSMGEAVCYYYVGVGALGGVGELGFVGECLLVGPPLEPGEPWNPDELPQARRGYKTIMVRGPGGGVEYHPEGQSGRVWAMPVGSRRSGLANLPKDESNFPVATWFLQFLVERVRSVAFTSKALRQPSPPNARRAFMPDGSSIPWLVEQLAPKDKDYEQWIAHLRTELPDLVGIRSVERQEDRHRYLMLKYEGGLEVPSWVVSDGTLEMLALTLLPYLPDKEVTYLVEEPENCVHPTAIGAIFESLSSVYDGQVLMATHSPVILGLAELEHVLCFTKDEKGAIRIVPGKEHRVLRNWRGEVSLGVLFASGVMG